MEDSGDVGAEEDDYKGDTISTITVRTMDTEEDDAMTVDTTFMDVQEIEGLRKQDAFLYHSIVQSQRRSNRGNLDLGDGGEAVPVQFDQFDVRASAVHASDSINISEILLADLDLEDTEDPRSTEGESGESEAGAGGARTSNNSTRVMREILLGGFEDQEEASENAEDDAGIAASRPIPPPRQQVRTQGNLSRRSQSLLSRTPSTHSSQRRFSQSFSGFATGVVKRQRRVSTECHPGLVVPDPEVIESFRRSMRSSLSSTVYEDEASDDSDTEIDEHIAALFDD
jgi:hypothetical protein